MSTEETIAQKESFPASGAPSCTPVMSCGDPHALGLDADLRQPMTVEERKVMIIGGRKVVHVGNGRGEELRQHLAAHAITATVSPAAETPFERVEVEDINPVVLQAMVDEWEK